MQVKDVMTSPAIGIAPTDAITDAIRLMLEHRVSGLPVITPTGELVGVVTEGDLMRRSELDTEAAVSWFGNLFRTPGRQASDYVHSHGRRVGDVMSERPVSIWPEAPLRDAVMMLALHNVRRLPVVKDDQVVGIISRSDILRALLPLIPQDHAVSDDRNIREAILREHRKVLPWSARTLIGVDVANGVVELTGTVTDDRVRTAARVAAENVKGVVSVVDHVVYTNPYEGVTIPPPPLL
ncbi:CBS domain-containing protein [Nguyenibacter vanlangensis]|uniref:CBS domain-containing protein n=1 Tax=Nguyenibacter vanlangensis TaxID=1216886 RepID=A0A7Y7IUS6_9PROT|nr:CBS domain-containing protein [Nguyenibacter vanlangensis]NVN10527.1 CBS domain-containing protein [Nguyenibacter vanlangensis]